MSLFTQYIPALTLVEDEHRYFHIKFNMNPEHFVLLIVKNPRRGTGEDTVKYSDVLDVILWNQLDDSEQILLHSIIRKTRGDHNTTILRIMEALSPEISFLEL